jgi:hypothetical protein
VGRQIILTDVRLDLDDPRDASLGRRAALANETGPDQAGGDLQGRVQ